MSLIIKAAAAAILGCVCVLLIKERNGSGAYALSICVAVLLCIAALSLFGEIFELINSLISRSRLSPAIFLPVIKCMGIGIVVSVVSSLCRDAGQSSTAAAFEYLGATAAVFTALPLIKAMLDALEGLL